MNENFGIPFTEYNNNLLSTQLIVSLSSVYLFCQNPYIRQSISSYVSLTYDEYISQSITYDINCQCEIRNTVELLVNDHPE